MAITALLSPSTKFRSTTAAGAPLVAGKVYIYLAGTTTLTNTYADAEKVTTNTNPVILDARGEANIFLDPANNYKILVTDSAGATVVPVVDNISVTPIGMASLAVLAGSTGSGLIGFLQSGSGAVLRTLQSKIREYWKSVSDVGAVLDGATDDTTAIQLALNNYEYVLIPGNAVCGGLIVPTTNRGLCVEGTLLANADGVTVLAYAADTTRSHIKSAPQIRISGNGKTGVTGLRFGTVTNNPSPGAMEAVLYFNSSNIYVSGCETGIVEYVSMEHDKTMTVLYNNTVGLKLYSDPVNGGANAMQYSSLRCQNNQVGMIVKNNVPGYAIPLHQNSFDSLILQSNQVCGAVFIGCNSIALNNIHMEGNGGGAASIVVDGTTIYKSDITLTRSQVFISDTDHAASLSPSILVQDSSRLITNGLTGYGSSTGQKVYCDATSTHHEIGATAAVGINNNMASYGTLTGVNGLGVVSGAAKCINIRGQNLYATPWAVDTTNVLTVMGRTTPNTEFGPTSRVTFNAVVGHTGANRVYFNFMTCTALQYNISSILVRASANCSFRAHFFAGAVAEQANLDLKGGVWTRVIFMSQNTADHQLFFYPLDTTGAYVDFTGFMCDSSALEVISDIYTTGAVKSSNVLAPV